MRRIKMLYYAHVFYPKNSGYANAFLNFIEALLDNIKTLEITVVTPYPLNGAKELRGDRLNIIRLKPLVNIKGIGYIINQILYAKRVSNIFNEGCYDLLFVETFEHAIFLMFLDKNIYNKLIVRVHATYETEYTFFVNRFSFILRRLLIKNFLIKRIKWILSTNKYHINFVKEFFFSKNIIKSSECNFFILPNPVYIPADIESKISSPCGKLKIVLLGRMDHLGLNQKGFIDVFFALQLLSRYILEKIDIIVIGSGNMKEYLIKVTKNIPNIRFIEKKSHEKVLELLIESDISILPSRYEGLSMFALESLATGNVVIFSNTGGLKDLVKDNGILFEPQNIEELAQAIKTIVMKKPDEIKKMKYNSIQICKSNFSPKVVANKFKNIYKIFKTANDVLRDI